jgi:hypothetical protein
MAGLAALEHNVGLTWAQDPGTVTELLSGRFYQPLGRSSTHQLWSSAMTLTPAVRGLFGLEADAPDHTLVLHPHLPPSWTHAELQHVQVGDNLFDVSLKREGEHLMVTATSSSPAVLCLRSAPDLLHIEACREPAGRQHRLQLPLPRVEVELLPAGLPSPGSQTAQPRVIEEQYSAHGSTFLVEAIAGSEVRFSLRRNAAATVTATGGTVQGDQILVKMPPGAGFVTERIGISW